MGLWSATNYMDQQKVDNSSKFKNSTVTIVYHSHPASAGDETSANETEFPFSMSL